MQMQQLSISALTTHAISTQFDGPVTALCAKTGNKLLVGDITGWLYSIESNDSDIGQREFGLRTQVTSISQSGSVCMVTSLGSLPQLLVMSEHSVASWVLRRLPPHVCSDVWCGQIWSRKAVIGGTKALVCFSDVERDEYIRLHRSSDVLALCQQDENLTFMGMRNGVIERWDSRLSGGKTDLVVNMSSERGGGMSRGAASVDYLRVVHEYELLIRTMRGDLDTHDLRFLRNNTPLLQFQGHVPTHESRLGIAVDPGQDFLFSGGGDSFLRIWSLRTGRALPPRTADSLRPSTAQTEGQGAPQPICAMDIVENDSGASLWIAMSDRVHRIHLGPRGLLL